MRAAAQIYIALRNANMSEDGFGDDCDFYQLSPEVGLKAYTSARVAISAYHLQTKLADRGLAPDCWGFSEVNGVCAFFTTVVAVAKHILTPLLDYCKCEAEIYRTFGEYLNLLCEWTKAEGFESVDEHNGNWGFLNGQPVWLDVSRFVTPAGIQPQMSWHNRIHA